jgi:hypothetical protein
MDTTGTTSQETTPEQESISGHFLYVPLLDTRTYLPRLHHIIDERNAAPSTRCL